MIPNRALPSIDGVHPRTLGDLPCRFGFRGVTPGDSLLWAGRGVLVLFTSPGEHDAVAFSFRMRCSILDLSDPGDPVRRVLPAANWLQFWGHRDHVTYPPDPWREHLASLAAENGGIPPAPRDPPSNFDVPLHPYAYDTLPPLGECRLRATLHAVTVSAWNTSATETDGEASLEAIGWAGRDSFARLFTTEER